MRPGLTCASLVIALAASSQYANAQTAPSPGQNADQDLDRLPQALDKPGGVPPTGQSVPALSPAQPASVAPATAYGDVRIALQDAATISQGRSNLPYDVSGLDGNTWEDRTSLAFLDTWAVTKALGFTLNDRLNLIEESGVAFPSTRNVRNDLLEGYLTWQPGPQTFVQMGRLNVRNGIALGFNPTDFFKTRTLIDQSSADPSVVREDRLGTVMLRLQYIWGEGAVSIAYAPRFYDPPPLINTDPDGLNPLLDRTNSSDRLLVTLSRDLLDLSPQALFYHDDDQDRAGLNISHPIGSSVVAYAEWAGGIRASLLQRALDFAIATGTFPASVPRIPGTGYGRHFENDLAVGVSWASSFNLTLNVEYHLHQSGLSASDLAAVFQSSHRSALRGDELLFVRGYAEDQGEPFAQQQVFLRASWDQFLFRELSISAFAFADLFDGSVFSQVSAAYNLSHRWTMEGFASANLGSRRTEYGSLAERDAFTLQLTRFF